LYDSHEPLEAMAIATSAIEGGTEAVGDAVGDGLADSSIDATGEAAAAAAADVSDGAAGWPETREPIPDAPPTSATTARNAASAIHRGRTRLRNAASLVLIALSLLRTIDSPDDWLATPAPAAPPQV
jgi:hypothetical protein